MNPNEIGPVISDLINEGKIREFGVSNFTKDQIELLSIYSIIKYNQIECSLTHSDSFNNGTLDYCQRKKINVMGWSPLGSYFKVIDKKRIRINSVIEKLVEIYKKKSDDILLISLLGTFYGLNKAYDQAIFFQKIAIEKAPFEPAFYKNLSETFKKVDKIRDALSFLYFAKILSLNDKSIDYEIAKLNTDLQNYLAADLIYTELLRERNINKKIIYSYCSNLIKLNKVNEAILFVKKVQINDSRDDILISLLGLAYFKLNKFELAKIHFLKAINLNKNNDNAHTNLGNCYLELGLTNQAEVSHNNSLKINPNNQMALNNLAALNFFKGDINNAEKLYTLSINKNEKNYEAKYCLAQCQLAKSNYKEGWSNFDFRWLSNDFNSPVFKSNLPKFKIMFAIKFFHRSHYYTICNTMMNFKNNT